MTVANVARTGAKLEDAYSVSSVSVCWPMNIEPMLIEPTLGNCVENAELSHGV